VEGQNILAQIVDTCSR